MYIVAILSGFKNFPLEESDYEVQFKQFASLGKLYDIRYVRAKIHDYVCEESRFSGVWEWNGESYVRITDIQPDLIISRINRVTFTPLKIGETIPFLNPFSFVELSHDKDATADFFEQRSPKTLTMGFLKKYPRFLSDIPGDTVIVKPRRGSKGIGVQKISKEKMLHEIEVREHSSRTDLVIQEFISMNKGVPGVVDGIHDLRVVAFGENMPFVIVRTPTPGDFRCNVAQEGKQHIIAFEELPESIQNAARAIAQRIFSLVGTKYIYYSIDLCQADDGRVILIELNTSIGLKWLEDNPTYMEPYMRYLNQLIHKKLAGV